MRENSDLKDLCLYLDEERSHDVTCPAPGCGERFKNPALMNTALTNTLGGSSANNADGGIIGGNSSARAARYVGDGPILLNLMSTQKYFFIAAF